MALTDINNTSCAYTFIEACRREGIKPIYGIEYRQVADPSNAKIDHSQYLYTGIAKNAEGIRELNALLTAASLDVTHLPIEAPEMQHSYIIYRSIPKGVHHLRENEYIGIRPTEVNKLYTSYLKDYLDKLVIYAPFTFKDKEGHRTHKLLRCIDTNTVLGKLDDKQCANASETLYTVDQLKQIYQQYPQIIANTERLMESCTAEMPSHKSNNRRTFTGAESSDMALLNKLAINGCIRRYGERNRKAMDRTKRELKVIADLGYSPYFLITWDIIRYAHTAGYHHVGRGSGANSIVAFNLQITDVDPLELDLYFERFINPHRSSPPDFDIDFSWDERDDVTDYIFKRYGREYTGLLATYNTFKGKSIIRELGKVFGLPKKDIDLIIKAPHATEQHHPYAKHVFNYGKRIEGFPNYLGIHAGGILITERPINYHTALQMMPKGFPIVHFDMYGAEDLHFHKYDVLSQRGLGHIKDAVKLIASNRGAAVDIHQVEKIKSDLKVKAQLKAGHCIGCFYIESPAMRGLLTKLGCDNYVHLVAASSIIRPGVAQSGMMREYIQRYHDPESFTYIHPIFERHLGETFGVMVYQEDVMKIVHHFAGLDLDESDVLRRIMTGKKKTSDTFKRLQEKYFRNCRERGYPEKLIHEVWRQIASFSGYSFCKAHSASFAVESFQSLYLKTYYPLEFMVAVINNFGGFYSTELYVHEARMSGGQIEAPCINHSHNLTTIEGDTIYIGFIHISELERRLAKAIVIDRIENGLYESMEEFVCRIKISREQLELLIRIGAFRFTGMSKYALMWEKNAVHNPAVKEVAAYRLFDTEAETYELPILDESVYEQAFDEIELLGFPLCSPFELAAEVLPRRIYTQHMRAYVGKQVTMVGYYVVRKNVTTKNRKLMNFGTWLDEEGNYFDTVHFPPSLSRYPFRGKGLYILIGKVVLDFEFPSIEVNKMEKLPYVADPRY